MANSIAVIGDTGSGKSTSMAQSPELGIKGLDPKETFIINVKNKPLPFRGWKSNYTNVPSDGAPDTGNYLASSDPGLIIRVLAYIGQNRKDIKNVVLDDYQYILSEQFMAKALQGGFEKFNALGKAAYDVLNAGINMPHDKNFIILTHDDEENGKAKLKSLGKMLDDKVNPIGLFTIALFTTSKTTAKGDTTYHFITNRIYDDRGILIPAKSPIGMFREKLIPNDLGLVIEAIKAYE